MISCAHDLIRFLERYHKPLLEEQPARPVHIPDIQIPETLRALYELFGHHTESPWGPLTSQDYIVKPGDLQVRGQKVVFVNENQGCWSCAYEMNITGHPVIRLASELGETDVLQTGTLDEFLTTFALQEAVMSSPWLLAVDGVDSWQNLKIDLGDLYRHGRYAFDGQTHDFWSTADAKLLCMKTAAPFFWVASYNQDILDVRLPNFEYQIVSPRDPWSPKTYVGRDSPSERLSSWPKVQRLFGWLTRPRDEQRGQ